MKTILLSCVVLCATGAVSSSQTTPPAQTNAGPPPTSLVFTELSDDTTITMPSGATFVVSKGWHVARREDLIVIEEPQRELAAAFLEVKAPTVEEAISQAWKRWKPDFNRVVRMTAKPPATQGWDEVAQTVYETAAAERRFVIAIARRKGSTYYVTLGDGTSAAAERRGAQMSTTFAGLKVPGREEENLAGRRAHTLDAARIQKFLAFAEDARVRTKIPGVALAVVQDGKIVLEKGLGLIELERNEPVTPATLFMIGSMTKPLTSLLMARLVDRGKFAWDTPVTKLFPSFALGDPDATQKLTMAHTVCACTGLPRWDMEFIFEWKDATGESRVDLMRAMKPTTGFGETFQYNNLMVASGGYIAAMTTTRAKDFRSAYATAMREEVLGPMAMTSTVLDLGDAVKREHARPHGRTLTFDAQPIPTQTEMGIDSVMPAGGAWSNVRDISRWMLLELNKGRLDGKQVVSEANVLERRKGRVQITNRVSYALALFNDESRGTPIIGHGGATFGFSSDAVFLPEHGIGLVVLTNAAAGGAYTVAVRRRLIELLLDANEEAEAQLAFGIKQQAEQIKKRLAEISLTPDPALVGPLLGSWSNPRLGAIDIRREGGRFILDAGEWKAGFGEHKDASGARKIILTDPPFAGFTFWPQEHEGRPALLFETAQQKYWFERQAVSSR